MEENKNKKKLEELRKEKLERHRLILEIRSKEWEVGIKKLISLFLIPIISIIIVLVLGYKFDHSEQIAAEKIKVKQERSEFLVSLLLENNSKKQTKLYSIGELKKYFLVESKDILKVVYEEDINSEVKTRAGMAFIESLDTLLSLGKIDSSTYFDLHNTIDLSDTLQLDDETDINEKKSWWLYLGNYNPRIKKWIPQPNVLGYTTSLSINIKSPPDSLLHKTYTSKRNVNLRKTYSTSWKVDKTLSPGKKVYVINVKKIKRNQNSTTNRIWLEVIYEDNTESLN